jgi:hypothetical protein
VTCDIDLKPQPLTLCVRIKAKPLFAISFQDNEYFNRLMRHVSQIQFLLARTLKELASKIDPGAIKIAAD